MRFDRLFFLIAVLFPLAAYAGESEAPTAYDQVLAEELGADEYGMRSYIFVMLRTGPAEITDKDKRSEKFAGHFSNMKTMAEAGKLVLAGPLSEGTDERGILILNVATIDEAKELMKNDPTVAAGIFTADYLHYYGSAALMMLNELHARVQRSKI